MKKRLYGLFLATLLVGMLTLVFNARQLEASGTIYIREDGSIDPNDGRIVTSDKVHYFFNKTVIYDPIVVERNNIIVDGAGYTLEGQGNETGIDLTSRMGVTIKNMTVKTFGININLQSSLLCTISQTNIKIAAACGISLNDSSTNTLSGNTLTNSGIGILLLSSSDNTLSGNTVNNDYYGIFLSDCSGNTISGNLVSNNKENGIVLQFSSSNTLSGNTVNNNILDGIEFYDCSSNTLSDNTVTNSYYGITLSDSSSNTLSRNTVNNNNLYGITLSDDSSSNMLSRNTVSNNGKYGIYLEEYSSSNRLSDNTVNNNNDSGIKLYHYDEDGWMDRNNTLSGNKVNNNTIGIDIYYSSNNTLSGNTVTNNNQVGISILATKGNINTLSNNNIAYNLIGISVIEHSVYCDVYHNNFVENEVQAVCYPEDSLNFWDNGYPSGGNYWSDYEGTDQNGDGIGDTETPHHKDRYPFIVPVGPIPVFYKGASYDCLITGNATVSQFSLEQDRTVNFRTVGHGWVNVTVPKELLGGLFRVFVNNTETLSFTSWNKEHTSTSIYFECRVSGSSSVRIEAEMKLEGDINGDGSVDILDIFKVAKNFGQKLNP